MAVPHSPQPPQSPQLWWQEGNQPHLMHHGSQRVLYRMRLVFLTIGSATQVAQVPWWPQPPWPHDGAQLGAQAGAHAGAHVGAQPGVPGWAAAGGSGTGWPINAVPLGTGWE